MRATALALAGVLAIVCSEARGQPTSYADEWLGQPVDDATFQNYLEFFVVDHEEPLDAELLDSQENDGVRREEWSFTSTPGERVYGHYFEMVTAPSSARSAIVVLHGGSGKDRPFFQRLAESLARGGFDVLAIDMKYWGRRETGLFTTFTEDDRHDQLYNRSPLYLDWMIQTVKDVQRSFDFLVTEKNIAPTHIGLLGGSRGAVVGAIAGAVERRFATVLLLHGGHFDAKEREHLPAACPANYIGRIGPRPLFTINSDNDGDFDAERSVRPLHRLINDSTEHRARWTQGGHSYANDDDWAAMFAWLRETLKPKI